MANRGILRAMTRRVPVLLAVSAALALSVPGVTRAGKSAEVRVESMTLLNEGVAAYNRGEYPLAIEKLTRSSALALNSFRAHYYLGQALIADRRYADAVGPLDVALDLEPSNLQAHVAMGNARLGGGDADEASASYTRALELRSEYPAGLDGLARVYESRADDPKAIELYQRAIASNKGYAEAYAHLGRLYLRLDRLDDAVRLLQEAVSIRADFAYGYNGLAVAYQRLGLPNEAVVAIRKAIELEPRSPEHWATMGKIELDLELASRADSSFRNALALDPGEPEAHQGLAESARRRGDYDAALAELDAAMADPRLDTGTRERIGKTREAMSAEGTLATGLEAEVAAGTAGPDALRRLAALCAGRRDWSRAADLEARALPEGPARERKAYYLLKAGLHRAAHDLYAELAAAAPKATLEINAGIALAGSGDDEGAMGAYRRALALDPSETRASLYLGNALLRQGRRSDAAVAYRAYAEAGSGAALERVRRILELIAPPPTGEKPGARP